MWDSNREGPQLLVSSRRCSSVERDADREHEFESGQALLISLRDRLGLFCPVGDVFKTGEPQLASRKS
jgi:hypothetical protein